MGFVDNREVMLVCDRCERKEKVYSAKFSYHTRIIKINTLHTNGIKNDYKMKRLCRENQYYLCEDCTNDLKRFINKKIERKIIANAVIKMSDNHYETTCAIEYDELDGNGGAVISRVLEDLLGYAYPSYKELESYNKLCKSLSHELLLIKYDKRRVDAHVNIDDESSIDINLKNIEVENKDDGSTESDKLSDTD